MFCPYCAWGGELLRLASLWSTDNQWLRLRQPLRHVAWFIVLSALVGERLPRCASAYLCLKCIPCLTQRRWWPEARAVGTGHFRDQVCWTAFLLLYCQTTLNVVVPIIPIFMIDLNRKSTNKKNQIDGKIVRKRSINSLIDDLSFIYDWQ